MKKNVLLFSHQMKVGGAPTVLCEMGKILNKKYNVVVLSPSDGAMRMQFEEAGISVLISGEITDALRDMIVQEFDFAVANTTLALPFVVKLAGRMPVYWWIHEGTLAYEGRQEMKEYYQFAAKYARIFFCWTCCGRKFLSLLQDKDGNIGVWSVRLLRGSPG